MERQRKPDGHAEDYPAYIQHLHARHHDGKREQHHNYPGVLFFHAHADLFFRQRDRDDRYEDDLNIRFQKGIDIP